QAGDRVPTTARVFIHEGRAGAAGLAAADAPRRPAAGSVSAARLDLTGASLLRRPRRQGGVPLLPLRRRRQRPGPVPGRDPPSAVAGGGGAVPPAGAGRALAGGEGAPGEYT